MSNLPEIQWHYLTLPGRFFSWRIRGNGLSFLYGDQAHLLEQSFDLIIATSMVDLATIKGLSKSLAATPSIIYFHENQFAYPKSAQQHASIEPQMVNLYSALSADRVLFNSEYNRHSFLAGVSHLLKRLPDHAPLNVVDVINKKSHILPVPIDSHPVKTASKFNPSLPLKVIWNHRWEYDKGPDTLLACIEQAHEHKLNVRFTVCGMSFRQIPNELQTLQKKPLPNVTHMGTFEDKATYLEQLAEHHVVLSTAHHEFQGLAMLEAAAQGCIPLAPNRLAYPEWIPLTSLYSTGNPQHEANAICQTLKIWQLKGLPPSIDVCHYDWQKLIPLYWQHIEQTITEGKHP